MTKPRRPRTSAKARKDELDRLRDVRNQAYAQMNLQIARSKATWDAAVNPFVAIAEYCTTAARAHRVDVYQKFLNASALLAAAEKKAKKTKEVEAEV